MAPVFGFAPVAAFYKSWMPPGVTDQDYVVAQYDGAIAYMDQHIARLLARLEELGIAENTIVVLTADHGETLTEHDCYFDHHGLYEPTIHVPLVIRAPGRLPAGRRVSGYVTHHDLVPTLLDLLGEQELLRATRYVRSHHGIRDRHRSAARPRYERPDLPPLALLLPRLSVFVWTDAGALAQRRGRAPRLP